MAGDRAAATPHSDDLVAGLVEVVPGAEAGRAAGDDIIRVPAAGLARLAAAARAAGFEMCSDITAVDYQGIRRTRFELVVHLLSPRHNRRLRILVPVTEDAPVAPSSSVSRVSEASTRPVSKNVTSPISVAMGSSSDDRLS